MSEYEFYEFRVIDGRLTDGEMDYLRRFSSRARITPTTFLVDYSWGGFRGNRKELISKYFDHVSISINAAGTFP